MADTAVVERVWQLDIKRYAPDLALLVIVDPATGRTIGSVPCPSPEAAVKAMEWVAAETGALPRVVETDHSPFFSHPEFATWLAVRGVARRFRAPARYRMLGPRAPGAAAPHVEEERDGLALVGVAYAAAIVAPFYMALAALLLTPAPAAHVIAMVLFGYAFAISVVCIRLDLKRAAARGREGRAR